MFATIVKILKQMTDGRSFKVLMRQYKLCQYLEA